MIGKKSWNSSFNQMYFYLQVVKCQTKSIDHPKLGHIEMVAVKYLKENAEAEMELTFQRELEILSNFDHPNVIPLVGVCLDKSGPMCLILGK